MVIVTVMVRELGSTTPDYSLKFELPEIPRVGSYISVTRPDTPKAYSEEDLVVRHVWWRLYHPETRAFASSENEKNGKVTEIVVECDPALGPWARDKWRDMMESATSRGVAVEHFPITRLSIRERELAADNT